METKNQKNLRLRCLALLPLWRLVVAPSSSSIPSIGSISGAHTHIIVVYTYSGIPYLQVGPVDVVLLKYLQVRTNFTCRTTTVY